jgi:4-alpha-glucanotransferase
MREGRTDGERALALLAQRHGVQSKYRDALGQVHHAPTDTLIRILSAMGMEIVRPEDAENVMRSQAAAWLRPDRPLVDPTTRVRIGTRSGAARVAMTLRVFGQPESAVEVAVRLESGEELRVDRPRVTVVGAGPGRVGATWRVVFGLKDPVVGYHRATVRVGGQEGTTLLLVHPGSMPAAANQPRLGLFTPPYALRPPADRDDGLGAYEDLAHLARWAAKLPAFVATLPLLPVFLHGAAADRSPYRPISRLFWSELYAVRDSAPAAARRVLWEAAAARRLAALDRARARATAGGSRPPGDELDRYAQFRAYYDAHPVPWWEWPEPARSGRIPPDGVDRDRVAMYRFGADAADRGVASLRVDGVGPLLDFPVGVHPAGYDVWRHRDLFAAGMNMGAPPDRLSAEGQDWAMPPLVPAALSRTGYRYWARSLRHHFRHAGVLRIDHVMGLHRLLWIPAGEPPSSGTYVHYPAEDLYAVVAIEACRANAAVVGEDLGTVPSGVRRAMRDRGIHRLYAVRPGRASPASDDSPPPLALASVGTHDMPPWMAAYGALPPAARRAWCRRLDMPEGSPPDAVYRATIEWLARSPARWVMVNLADLWLDPEPENRPGTPSDQNWAHRHRAGLDAVERDEALVRWLQTVAATRAPSAHPEAPAW